jgi:GH15 family glucan-1,4-alpha-glucosidase
VADAVSMCADTENYWREWVRSLTLPLEWQEAVIRAAITLKLCMYEETGAIVAALTTSVPEAPDSGRNWDYRYCWIRDAYYVVRALTRLGAADILENYLGYLRNLMDHTNGEGDPGGMHVQPVFGVGFETELVESQADALSGYRGMGPVRIGNQAYEHNQHDVYGQVVMPLSQSFYDHRLLHMGDEEDFRAMEALGERAFALHDQPDAGLWEFRTKAAVHTYSSVLCWAACDRLAKAATALGLEERNLFWRERAEKVHARIEKEAWNEEQGRYVSTFGGKAMDASLLQLAELGFVSYDDPRYRGTLAGIEADLKRGEFLLRYAEADDFGMPDVAFTICTFWYVQALNHCDRSEEARALFEKLLARRTRAGLLSEDIAPETGELWGNYPQTYSLVGLIACAAELSRPWTSVR